MKAESQTMPLSKTLGTICLALALTLPAAAGPALEASAGEPAIQAAPTAFEPEVDLKRLMIGNQAGIVKVFERDSTSVAFFRGIDDKDVAPLDDAARRGIFTSLNLQPGALAPAASRIMSDFYRLPRKQAVALLGVVGSAPTLDRGTAERLQSFVCVVLEDPDVATRRQAILALALVREPTPKSIEAVVKMFETSQNLWETFPVQQFFQYHAKRLRAQPGFPALRQRLSKVESLYTPNILGYLDL